MRLSNSYFFTKREDSKEEETVSGNLLVRSGMIKKAGSGIYYFLPLGLKVIRNIEQIVREEMNNIGSEELVMPSLLPEDVYVNSGRRDVFGNDMFSLKDRNERSYVLGPTHEEMFLEVAKEVIKSYKDMPISLYQIANKYRDEPRPRFGLIRVREFIMKDAYTFDKDLEGLDKSYQLMFDAYKKIFDRIGVNYRIVRASTGAMGGLLSEEFQAVTEIGEDTLVLCDKCKYSSNIEISEVKLNKKAEEEELKTKELIHTPNVGTIDDLVSNYHFDTDKMVKTLIVNVKGKLYACMIKSNRELNILKLSKLLDCTENDIELATEEEVEKATHAKVGFAGPIGLDIPIIIDQEVTLMKNFLTGANKTDYHYVNVNLEDFKYSLEGDIRNIAEDDICPVCGAKLEFKRGIEVGNTFKLGDKYSKSLGLSYSDADNNLVPVQMGSYGIGIARVLAAVVEQNHDESGMILPLSIAPYKVAIVLISNNDQDQVKVANEIYQQFKDEFIEVLLDDRDERPGVKFKDMDLIGIPIRITVGKKVADGKVELKYRDGSRAEDINIADIKDIIRGIKGL